MLVDGACPCCWANKIVASRARDRRSTTSNAANIPGGPDTQALPPEQMSSRQVEGQIVDSFRAEPALGGTNIDAEVATPRSCSKGQWTRWRSTIWLFEWRSPMPAGGRSWISLRFDNRPKTGKRSARINVNFEFEKVFRPNINSLVEHSDKVTARLAIKGRPS